jgi:hypothetical protein
MKLALTTVSLAVALAACGKVQEAASEKAAEKMIESAIGKDGQKASVDITGGGAKITTTDASGKTSQMEMGTAKVTEADLGVPFYPGTQPTEGQATRVTTPDGTMTTVGLQSPDAPDKVAAFYRDRLKAQSEGKQFMDMSDGQGGTTLMLSDDKAGSAVQIHVQKAEQGSEIQVVASQGKSK